MTQENLQNETEIRRFLLGEMREDERIGFEENFIADEDLFEQTRLVEDELTESYVRGTLSVVEKERFEKNFLSTETRRRRVEFTRTMLNKLSEQKESAAAKKIETADVNPSVWNSITDFFKTPKLAFGAVFALLILIFGGWFLLGNLKQTEIVKQVTPTPTSQTTPTIEPNQNQSLPENTNNSANIKTNVAGKIVDNKNTVPNVNKNLPDKNQNTAPPPQNTNGITPILALFAGGVRSEGKMAELNLPKNAVGANLQLNLESQDYQIYQVEITDPDGRLIAQNKRLKAKNSKINLFVSAAKLQKGDYLVKLSALNPNNETESVADYSFRVNR